ncbi:tyrosine-protein kinase shark-like isoform X1, partial [Dinothrombium tinctorium]
MIMQRKTIADLANAQCWSPLSGGRCSSPESPAFTPSNKVTYYSESMSSACDELRKWYFEGINREEAEDILRVNISNSVGGGLQSSDGLFLVRNGFCTQAGEEEFVLSTVQCNGRILHYQIRKCAADDAFYCIDEGRVVHGLDTLIEQMIVTDPNRSCRPKGARLVLRRACRGGQYPPAECRLHGRTNLLHRATKQANHSV